VTKRLIHMMSLRTSRRRALMLAAGAALYAAGCTNSDDDDSPATPTRPPAPTPDATQLAERAIVRQVDHILLKTDDAPSLFTLLTDTLQIPVAWPIFTYRGFHSGAAGFGNVNLEVLQHAEGGAPDFARAPGIYPIGIAFEPVTVGGALRELEQREIEHSEPFEDGISDAIRWTSVDLEGAPQSPIRLLVKYAFDQDARRAMLGSQLRERNGGPLGVMSLQALELEASDVDAARTEWKRLLDPIPESSPGTWTLGNGPRLRLVAGDGNRFRRIIVAVRSLRSAIDALRERDLLGDSSGDYADLAPADGAIRFVEAQS
jgi:hypothetical protein